MSFIADLHIHSKYSRATSKDMSPEGIWTWAQLKEATRILTAFDVLSAAEQLLGMKLRPSPGTWRGRFAVAVQRMLARGRQKRN